jgi:type II secretory pathway component GspD/PulD (secretin)
MMKLRLPAALVLAIFVASAAIAQEGAYRLVFSKADVEGVLKAISLRTGAKVIYSQGNAGTPKLVTLDVTVNSAEEGVRAAVASAGLMFRRVGNFFVVAEAEQMKGALAPFAVQAKFAVSAITPEDAATLLEKAVPTVTARPAGARVLVSGIPEDLVIARDILAEREAQLEAQVIESEWLPLRFVSSDAMAKMIVTLFPGLKVTPSGGPNQIGGTIALSGAREQVRQATLIIREMDVPVLEPIRDIGFRVYEVRYASAVVLQEFLKEAMPEITTFVGPESYTPPQPSFKPLSGATLSQASTAGTGGGTGSAGSAAGSAAGSQFSSGGGVQPFQKAKEGDRAKHLVLRGPALALEAAMGMLAQVDVKPLQVQVEVLVVDVSPEKLVEAGWDYSWRPFTFIETPPGTGFSGKLPPTGNIDVEATNLPTKAGLGALSRIPWRFDVLLRGLITKREAKVLASPNVVVVDNDDATIFIGDTLRVQLAQGGGLGGTTIQVVEFPVGIVLLLRPRVNADGNVTMRVHPVVSAITSIGDNNLPQTSTREAETTLVVKDGETVVLGGLIREDMTRTVREVPILADIPILGELFKSRSTSSKRSDILLFITTRIVKDNVKAANPGELIKKPELPAKGSGGR